MIDQWKYNLIIFSDSEAEAGHLVKLGEDAGWVERHRQQLAQAEAISLVPKILKEMPTIRINLGSNRKWILFSRVTGKIEAGKPSAQQRHYVVGYQNRTTGEKTLIWVDDSGLVSVDSPGM